MTADASGAPSAETRIFDAFLFDMDGTVLTSLEAANRVWTSWATAKGLDPVDVLAVMHGVRAEDTVRRFAPNADIEAEAQWITEQEVAQLDGVDPFPGAVSFVSAIPAGRWAIVTSAPRRLALARLGAAGLPVPTVMICAEDVARGKPDPEPYRTAALALGFAPSRCLVWEDAPAGIEAGRAAGCALVVLKPGGQTDLSGDWVVEDYLGLAVRSQPDGCLKVMRRT